MRENNVEFKVQEGSTMWGGRETPTDETSACFRKTKIRYKRLKIQIGKVRQVWIYIFLFIRQCLRLQDKIIK